MHEIWDHLKWKHFGQLNEKKRKTWNEIAEKVNSDLLGRWTLDQCKKKWISIKSKSVSSVGEFAKHPRAQFKWFLYKHGTLIYCSIP